MHTTTALAGVAVFLPTAAAFFGAPLPLAGGRPGLAATSRAGSLSVNMNTQDAQPGLNRRRFVGGTIGGAAVSALT